MFIDWISCAPLSLWQKWRFWPHNLLLDSWASLGLLSFCWFSDLWEWTVIYGPWQSQKSRTRLEGLRGICELQVWAGDHIRGPQCISWESLPWLWLLGDLMGLVRIMPIWCLVYCFRNDCGMFLHNMKTLPSYAQSCPMCKYSNSLESCNGTWHPKCLTSPEFCSEMLHPEYLNYPTCAKLMQF